MKKKKTFIIGFSGECKNPDLKYFGQKFEILKPFQLQACKLKGHHGVRNKKFKTK